MPASSVSKASSPSGTMRPIVPAAATTGSRRRSTQNQEFAIVGYKDATHLKGAIGALVLGYYKDGKLTYAGRSGTGYTVQVGARPVEEASAAAPRHARVRQASRGGARPQGHLGRAEARRRGRVQRLHRAGPRPPRGVQGPARGQAREGSRAGDADADEIESQEDVSETGEARRAKRPSRLERHGGQIHQPRPRLLARRRGHQAAACRLLHRRVGAHRTASGKSAARAAALPRRHRRAMLLPEARAARASSAIASIACKDAHGEELLSIDGSRRAAHAGAGGRAGNPRLGLDHRGCRALRPHRVRSRSGRRRAVGRGQRGGARAARAPRRSQAQELREDDRRQGPARDAAGQRRAVGSRRRISRTRWCWRWRRTRRTSTCRR